MRIFKTKPFAKIAKTEGLTDAALKQAIKEVQEGLVDARLGSNLIKKRVAIGGKGKSGGLRTILVYQQSVENVFCVYLFSKKEQENISTKQLEQLRLLAGFLLSRTTEHIKIALIAGELQEVSDEDEYEKRNESKSNERKDKSKDK